MEDNEKQALISTVIHGEKTAKSLGKEEFLGLLDGLRRMFFARVFNCVDDSGKWDTEWIALSGVCERAYKEIIEGNGKERGDGE